jgi:hypothetical protein
MMKNLSLDRPGEGQSLPELSSMSTDLHPPSEITTAEQSATGRMTTDSASVLGFQDVFDVDMDPSFLFQYPPAATSVGFEQDVGMPFELSAWGDFLNETQMDFSPDGSGGSST